MNCPVFCLFSERLRVIKFRDSSPGFIRGCTSRGYKMLCQVAPHPPGTPLRKPVIMRCVADRLGILGVIPVRLLHLQRSPRSVHPVPASGFGRIRHASSTYQVKIKEPVSAEFHPAQALRKFLSYRPCIPEHTAADIWDQVLFAHPAPHKSGGRNDKRPIK